MKANLFIAVILVFWSSTTFAESNSPNVTPTIPKGLQAVKIHVGLMTLMHGNVKTGDQVDILTTHYDPLTKQSVTRITLQDVTVLAVDREKTDLLHNDGMETSMTLAVPSPRADAVRAADAANELLVSRRPVKDEIPGQNSVLSFREAQRAIGRAFAYIDDGKINFKSNTVTRDEVEPLRVNYGFDQPEQLITVEFRMKNTVSSNYYEVAYGVLSVLLSEEGELRGQSGVDLRQDFPSKQWKLLPHSTP